MSPELAPRLYLKFDGTEASEQITDAVISVEVDDSLTLPDMFAVHLRAGSDLALIDGNQFVLGMSVEISAGREAASEITLLKGEITAVEPRINREMGPTLVLRGYDKSHRLNRERKTQTFLNVTDSDIANKIAQDNGLSSDVDSTSEVHDYVQQDNKTDWEFIIQRAQRVGFRVLVSDDTLEFKQSAGTTDQTPTLDWADELLEFNARLSTARQVSEVIVQGWDPENQQQIVGRATQPNGTPQIGESQQGGEASQQAFGGSPREIIVNRPVSTQAEADLLAQSVCDEIGQGFIQAECVCIGNPQIQAGAMVTVQGIGDRFSGSYRVTHATHRYDASGYQTDFTLGGSHASTISELLSTMTGESSHCPVLGVVTNNDDPLAQGRVSVRIPSIADSVESTWARLVTIGGGNNRGIQWVPEVSDEVLVLFEHDDINRPLVVGGLWSDQNAIPNNASVSDGAVDERIIQSRSGHVITLDDTDGSEKITIKDMTGNNKIEIDSASNTMTINTDDQVTIEASGNISVKSTGGNLSFEGNKMEIKTSGDFKVDATGSCDIKSNGNCTVEGTAGLTIKNAAAQIAMSGPTVNVNNGALEVT